MSGVQQLPADMIGLAGLLIVVLGGVIRLAINQRTQLKQMAVQEAQMKAQGVQMREVHAQVRNDHPEQPNLRDTIDDIVHRMDDMRAAMRDVQDRTIARGHDIAGLRADVGGLRGDLQTEIARSTTTDQQLITELAAERERSIIADNNLARRLSSCTALPDDEPEP